jgi:hypothetical protein
MNSSNVQSWLDLLSFFAPAFTAPTFALFLQLASAWVLCPGRHTLTRLYSLAEPKPARQAGTAPGRYSPSALV